jgi:hypothetical protein
MAKKTARMIAAIGAAAAGLSLVSPLPAQAAERKCAYLGRTELCINADGTNYRASMFTGQEVWGKTLNFQLWCSNSRWFGDEGQFDPVLYRQYTYIFKVGRQGNCWVKLIDHDNGKTLLVTPGIST